MLDFTSKTHYLIWKSSTIWAEEAASEADLGSDEEYKKFLRASRQIVLTGNLVTSSVPSVSEKDLPSIPEKDLPSSDER